MEMGGKLMSEMRPCLTLRSSYGAEQSASVELWWVCFAGKLRILRVLRLCKEASCTQTMCCPVVAVAVDAIANTLSGCDALIRHLTPWLTRTMEWWIEWAET